MCETKTADTRTLEMISIPYELSKAISMRALRDNSTFSRVVQAALEAFLLVPRQGKQKAGE